MGKLYFLLFLILTICSTQVFSQNYTVLGSASQQSSCNFYQLTPNSGDQAGAIFQNKTINMNNSFDFTFNNFFGCNGANGADGEAFVLTSNPNGLGNQGDGLGYGGPSQPCSFAVEFDTWQNSSNGDPSYDHTAFESGGQVDHNVSGPVAALPSQSNLDNCQWHTIRIVWDVNTQTMSDYVDGNLRISMVLPNFIATFLCNNPIINWGWTGSTGGGWNLQQVKVLSTSSWVAGTNYESCSPTVQFTDVSTSQIGPLNSWQWSFGDGGTSTIQNPTHTYAATGTYTATLIVTDASGCPDTFSHAVTINAPITLTPTLTNPKCNGAQTGTIYVDTAGGFGSSAGHGGFSFNWSNGSQQQTNAGLGAGTYTVTVTDGVCSATGQYTLNQPTALTATTSSTAANCGTPNGTCTIVISGGTPPYQGVTFAGTTAAGGPSSYTASGFLGGTYIANFEDANSCSALLQYTATVPTLPCGISSSTSQVNVACFGASTGSATLTVTGTGVAPPATITWTKGGAAAGSGVTISNLTAGTYDYTYTDQTPGNAFSGSIVITQPSAAMVTNLVTSNISCAGNTNGQAIASVSSGGTSPFSYAWSAAGQGNNPVASNLGPGNIDVTISDANGCSVVDAATISSTTPLDVSITVTNNACNQGNNGSATALVTGGTPYTVGGTPSYTYYWSNISSAKTDLSLSGGNYSVTVTDSLGCTATRSTSITEAAPLLNSVDSTNVKCYGDSTGTITVNTSGGAMPYTYTWSSDTVGFVNPALTGANLTNLKAGEYLLTVTDANGCQFWDSTFLRQPALPLTVDTAHGNVTCYGAGNGFIAINISGGTSPYTYQGIPVPAGPDTLFNQPPGTYTGVIMDANQCSVTNSMTITSPPADSLVMTSTNNPCAGNALGSATADFVNPNGAVVYNWSNSQSGPTISGLTANTYSVTATDANSCSFTGSVTISQPPAIALAIALTGIQCYGQTNGNIIVTPTGGTGAPYTYAWSPNVSTDSIASALTGGAYIVTVTDANGCTKDSLLTVTQPSAALAALYQTTNIACYGSSTGSIAASTSGGTLPYSYNWAPPGTATATDSAAMNLPAGTYNVTITDANGCTVDSFFTLTQPASALALDSSQHDSLSCYGSNDGSATVVASGGTSPYTYAWTPNVSTGPVASSLPDGNYTVTVTDNDQCTATAQYGISQPKQIINTLAPVDILCFGAATGKITVTTTGGVQGAGYAYNWAPDVSINNVATGLVAGTYAITVTDATNCTATASVSLTQNTAVTVTPATTPVTCFGNTDGTLTAAAAGGTPGYNYSISDGTGNTIPGNSTGNFTSLASSPYTVIALDQNGCGDTVVAVVAHPNPITDQVTAASQSCSYITNGQVDVQASGGNGGYTFSGQGLPSNTSGIFTGLAPGTYYLTITDAKGCVLADSATLLPADTVQLSVIPANGQVKLGDSLQLTSVNNQPGNVSYLWTPPTGLSCYDCPDPVFNGVYSQPYTVRVTNDSGCVSTFSFTVTVLPDYDFFIPNAFTPNGDGKNDYWQLYGSTNNIKQLQVMVFDRIGEKVFESNDVNFVWDGMYKGQYLPQGVYVYTFKIVWLDNKADDHINGSITLLR